MRVLSKEAELSGITRGGKLLKHEPAEHGRGQGEDPNEDCMANRAASRPTNRLRAGQALPTPLDRTSGCT